MDREARALIARGQIELIGSGYAQIIAPLVPARVTEENLAIGNECYERLLGIRPSSHWSMSRRIPAGWSGFISMPAIAAC